MKNMNRKGFTLVELLAVIIILGIIMLITVPLILSQLKKAEKKSFEISIESVKKNTENYLIKEGLKQLPDCDKDGVVLVEKLNLKNKENAFLQDSSYICYNSKSDYQCNYLYAVSKNKNFIAKGCYDDIKIIDNDKTSDYTAPKYNTFDIVSAVTSLTVNIDWYDDESGISSRYYAIRKHGTSKWSAWQEEKVFTGLIPETQYDIKSMAINGVDLRSSATKLTETLEEGAPSCELTVATGTLGKGGYYQSDVKVMMTTSEVVKDTISFTGPVTTTTPSYATTITSGSGTAYKTITQNGTTTLYGYVKTSSSKKSSCSKIIKKDSNPEGVSINGVVKVWNSAAYVYDEIAHTSGVWTNKNVILKPNITEGTAKAGYKSTYTYQWFRNGVAISGATSSTYTASTSGNYTVKVASGSGKTATSNEFVVKIDTSAPTIPTVSVNNYGRSLTFNYSSTDTESGIDKYKLKYKKSTESTWTSVNTTSTTYSINTNTNTTYQYIVCAYNKAGVSKCSTSASIQTYTGLAAGNYSYKQEVTYAGKQWYVISDSGSTKGSSYVTLLSKSLVGSASGNSYNDSLTYLNGTSYKTEILSSDCGLSAIKKQNGYCITTDSGSKGIINYNSLSNPYWIGSGKVVLSSSYNTYSLTSHNYAQGYDFTFNSNSALPSESNLNGTTYSAYSSSSISAGTTKSVGNSDTSFTYAGSYTTSNWYGSDYFICFIVRPNGNTKYRLSITKYAATYPCGSNPSNCVISGDTFQTFTGTGTLSVRICGGTNHGRYLVWKGASTAGGNFTYGWGSNSTTIDPNAWHGTYSAMQGYLAGKSTSSTTNDTTYGTNRLYDNAADGNCVNHRTQSISNVTKYYYYRPYIIVKESYDKDGN